MSTATKQQERSRRRKSRLFSWRAWDTPDAMLKARKLYIKQHPKPATKKPVPTKPDNNNNNSMDESD